MKRIERILLLMFIIGVILKFLLIPGNGLIITVSLMSLSIMYYVFSFAFFNQISLRNIFKREAYKEISAWKIIGTVVLGFSLSCAIIGILFKLQSWEGEVMMTFVGSFCLFICLIVALSRYYKKNKPESYKLIFSRILIVGVLSLTLYSTPRSSIVAIFKRNYPDYVQAVKNLENDPHNQYLQEEEKRQRHLMQSNRGRKKIN